MGNSIPRQNRLPVIATLFLLVGAVLILTGVVVQFVGRPELGGKSVSLYEIAMGGGAVCIFLGTWLSWRWSKGQKSRTVQIQ
jgi:hypothetical protein